MQTIQLDPEMAKDGAMIGANTINKSGAYVGKITEAKAIQKDSGAAGIEFTFERDDGAQARYITVYTQKKDGNEAFGMKQIQALMACLKTRSVTQQNRAIKEYDHQYKQMMDVTAAVYPELENKPVGLVLKRESYTNNNGEEKFKFNIVAPFNAETRQLANELLDQKPAEILDKIIESLIDEEPAKPKQAQHQGYQTPPVDLNDDIPF
jgi:hypothetical protein